MKTVDEILAIIDTGLQTAGDSAYGDDWPHTCWRCGETAEDLCDPCRTELVTDKPVRRDWITILLELDVEAFLAALDRIAPSGLLSIPGIQPTNKGAKRMTTTDKLGTFDNRDVITTSVAITNAGDGLSQALGIDPQVMHIGDTGVIVLEYTVTKIGFVEIKDTDVLNRVHTLRAGTAVIVDRELVAEALDAQALKIEKAKGVQRIPGLDGNGDGEGDDPE